MFLSTLRGSLRCYFIGICIASIGPQTLKPKQLGRVDEEAEDTLEGLTQAIVQWATPSVWRLDDNQ